MQNFEERLRTCVRQEGRHLSDIIFRNWVINASNQNCIYYRLFWCWHNFFILKINKVTIIWKTCVLFAPPFICNAPSRDCGLIIVRSLKTMALRWDDLRIVVGTYELGNVATCGEGSPNEAVISSLSTIRHISSTKNSRAEFRNGSLESTDIQILCDRDNYHWSDTRFRFLIPVREIVVLRTAAASWMCLIFIGIRHLNKLRNRR